MGTYFPCAEHSNNNKHLKELERFEIWCTPIYLQLERDTHTFVGLQKMGQGLGENCLDRHSTKIQFIQWTQKKY